LNLYTISSLSIISISYILIFFIVTSVIVTTESSSVTAGLSVTFTCRVTTVGRGTVGISWINDNPRNRVNTQVNGPTDMSTDTLTVNRAHFLRLTVTGT